MRKLPLKLVVFSLFTLLPFPSIILAEQVGGLPAEGLLQKIKHIPGENIQIQLDDDWYSIENNSDIFMCDKKMKEKNLNDLNEFIDYRLSLIPSAKGTYHKIDILCE